ncbi:MAG: CHAD domain-containing protein [Phascolarctobacterium sp.]
MKAKLCLHGVDIKHQAQLLGLVKKLVPQASISYKVKEKYFPDNDMYKCRVARFEPKARGAEAGYRVLCAWGVLLVSDKLVNIADITFEFSGERAGAVAAVHKMLERLLAGKQHFVLDEPDLARRIALLRGCYFLDKLEGYAEEDALTALRCHVPWHLYSINKLWEQLLWSGGGQRPLWRQLRVKLRRLRSVLALVKPLFPEADKWKDALKARADVLSGVREYDVLLQTCERLRMGQSRLEQAESLAQQGALPVVQSTMVPVDAAAPQLQRLLAGLRQQAQVRTLGQLQLNAITLELAELYVALYKFAALPCEMGLGEFLAERLGKWATKLQEFSQGCPDGLDMEQLHRVRIKLKRFRYALQSVPELAASPQLLRALKYLQDMLGVLHDDFVNERYLEQLVAAHPELPELRYEVAMLRGYEQARADAAAEQLTNQWQEFNRLLSEWVEGLG